MALTVGDFLKREIPETKSDAAISIKDMQILGPVIVPEPRIDTPQLLRIDAQIVLETGDITVGFSTASKDDRVSVLTARCRIVYEKETDWLRNWRRSNYLVQKRMVDLECGVSQGVVDKLSKKTVYQLFSAVVDYAPMYQGLQEVIVNTEELEATAIVKDSAAFTSGNFFCSPLWVDNMAQLAGFVLNGMGIVDPRVTVYIAQGWTSFQAIRPVASAKPYKVHVKLNHEDETTILGDVSITHEDVMVGLISEVRFHRMPKALFDRILASPAAQIKQKASSSTVARFVSNDVPKPLGPTPGLDHSAAQSVPTPSPVTQIMQIIADEIGVPRLELKDSSEFDELGVDSLLSLTIHSRIREELQMDLSPDVFQTCVRIGDLLDLLNSSRSHSTYDNTDNSEQSSHFDSSTTDSSSEPDESSDVEMISSVHQVVAAEIGVSVPDLIAADDLSSLGVDSLMSLTIVGTLREKLGIVLPPEAIQAGLTMKSLSQCVDIKPTLVRQIRDQAIIQPDTRSTKLDRSDVVLLQGSPRTATRSLFLFPDGSGSATSYLGLPGISTDICVFAINSPFIKNPKGYTCSLEETARLMVQGLRQRQPIGPYILAGWSAGGMYAFEAARFLLQEGESVEKLILIDSPCRLDFGPMPQDVLEYVSRSGVIGGKGNGTAPQWLVDHFQRTIRAVKAYEPKPLVLSETAQVHLLWARRGVFEDWPSGQLVGLDLNNAVAAWLLKPKEKPGPQGWDRLIQGGNIQCAMVDGNHFSMVHDPHVSLTFPLTMSVPSRS